jgi:hypothetical protein
MIYEFSDLEFEESIFIYYCSTHDKLLTLFLWRPCFCYLMQFLETGPELGSHYNEVIAAQDVATYGGLCALATFDRAELKASSPFYFHDDSSSKRLLRH